MFTKLVKYSLGLDIGTTSIGWAVIDEDKQRIHDVGVRIFEKPEDPQSGKSLAEPRRTARSARRRLKRRRQRLEALKSFFIDNSLLTSEKIAKLLAPESNNDPYEIRERAINEKVTNDELFIALYHIAKRRGYKSNRKSVEEADKGSNSSRVLSAISKNTQLLRDYDTKSIALVLNNDSHFAQHKRNKRDDYTNSFIRQNFEDEAREIIATQRQYGLTLDDEQVYRLLYGDERHGIVSGIFSQRPFMTDDLIQRMRGDCELDPNEKRAPKASISFEMFRLAQNLAHLRVVTDRETRALTPDEILRLIDKAKSVQVFKYAHIREVLGYKNDASFQFSRGMIRGKIKNDDPKGGEGNTFDELKFYHAVRKALADLPDEWRRMEGNQDLFDEIGYVLTTNKDDENLRSKLTGLNLSQEAIDQLLGLNFSGFAHLSLKALRTVTPHLLNGETYDRAVELAGYKFSQQSAGDNHFLPPLSAAQAERLTNPIVKRAISQTIKVINAVIRKYGPPNKIKIEAANELARNFSDRQKIEKMQKDNAAYNESIKDRLEVEFGIVAPTGLQITKFKLYNQQNCKCVYSGGPLEIDQLFSDERYAEIDHVIPFSRCGNDGLNNKVLVLSKSNQDKGNLTPFEAWGTDEARWREFEARVRALNLPYPKKDRLLAHSVPDEEWNKRAISDTRYISKFLRQFVRDNLKFAQYDDEKGKQRVITPSGPITSYLRRAWRVGSKNREDNNLHHATDACIVAAIDHSAISRVSRLNKYYELFAGTDKNKVVNRLTGEILCRKDLEQHNADIQPWEDFGKEVRIRTRLYSAPSVLHNDLEGLKNYDDVFRTSVKPIFVSRMPKRSGRGPTNKDTLRSPKVVENYENSRGEKVIARKQRVASLMSVDMAVLNNSPVRESDQGLYQVLKTRLEENDNDPKKAFARPVFKPTKSGAPGNIVRRIKAYDTSNSKSGFLVNGGKGFVNNGAMIRLDVYRRKNYKGGHEYYFAPVYVHLIRADKVEILPTPNGRSVSEKADFDAIREPDGKVFATADNGFEKQFSVYPNDYVRIYMANKIVEGYYVKYNIKNGSLNLLGHSSSSKDDASLISVSPRAATGIERFDISVLGDNYKWV